MVYHATLPGKGQWGEIQPQESGYKLNSYTLFQKQISTTFPGPRLIFPGLQISPYTLSFLRFQNQFLLQSTYNSYKINSENFIALVRQISKTFQDLQSFTGVF